MENKQTVPQEQTEKPVKSSKRAARETLYRVTLRNQVDSVAIADQKANIIIGINTILISIIIAITSSETALQRLQFVNNLKLSIPFTIMFVTSFISGVIAFFVVRPVIRPWRNDLRNKLFFKNYDELSLDQFLQEMKVVHGSADLIYEHLNTDMYLLGQTVVRKYRYLRYAYFVFLGGLVLTVLSFSFLQLFT